MIVAASYAPSAPPLTPYRAPYMCTLRCDCRPNPTQHCPFIRWDPLLQLKKGRVEHLHLPSRTSTRLDPLRADTASAEAFPSKSLPLLCTDKIKYSVLSPPPSVRRLSKHGSKDAGSQDELELPKEMTEDWVAMEICVDCKKFITEIISSSRRSLCVASKRARLNRKTQSFYMSSSHSVNFMPSERTINEV